MRRRNTATVVQHDELPLKVVRLGSPRTCTVSVGMGNVGGRYRGSLSNNQPGAQFVFIYVYFYSLHVSGNHVPIFASGNTNIIDNN
jgi:hypothetical protein